MASLSVVTWTVKSLSPSGLSVFGPAACLGIFRSWESSMVVTVRVCPKPKTNGLWIASRNDRATRGRPLIAAHGCRWRNEVREDQLSLANATRFGGAQANSSRNPTQTTTRISSIVAWRWARISTPRLRSRQVLTGALHVASLTVKAPVEFGGRARPSVVQRR
jgi:hypothetical protein